MHIAIGEKKLSGSPVRVMIEAAEVSPEACLVEGEGVRVAAAGERVQVRAWLCDGFNNLLSAASVSKLASVVKARLELVHAAPGFLGDPGAVDTEARVSAEDSGAICISYTSSMAGLHSLHVSLGHTYLARAPYPVQIYPGSVHPPRCEARGAAVRCLSLIHI